MKSDVVVFFPDDHTYWLGNTRLQSVGGMIKKFEWGFDEEYWLTHKTLKNLFGGDDGEYMSHFRSFNSPQPPDDKLFIPFLDKVDPTKYLNEREAEKQRWHRKRLESTYWGTKFHEQLESEAYEAGFKVSPFDGQKYPVINYNKDYANESQFVNLAKLQDGLHLELMIFDLELGLCGMADEVYIKTKGKYRYFDIDDHKTNEEKPSVSKNKYKPGEKSPSGFKPPIEHLKESTHNIYALKISTYAYMLERHGFKARNLAYTWYKDYNKDTGIQVPVEYFKNEVDSLFI